MRFDFPTILIILVVVTGLISAFDIFVLAKRRRAAVTAGDGDIAEEAPPSKIAEYARSFFPVFLIVFALRSFVVEPFRIPSGSMMPTLLVGDFILVNKFTYGIRFPVVDKKLVAIGDPKRGDVVVFRSPRNPGVPFIKRIVGLPGDRIDYYGKVVYINGRPAGQTKLGIYEGAFDGLAAGESLREEDLAGHAHLMLANERSGSSRDDWVVPEGHYFVLGDNRDNSHDSRFWGYVPDENLIGRAFIIWMNWRGIKHGIDWPRMGTSIR